MDVRKDILEKHSTGQIYISPASIHYADGKIRQQYWCEMSIVELLRYYMLHLNNPPTSRCYDCCADPNEGIIRIDDPTDEEMSWLSTEFRLGSAINNFFGNKEDRTIRFVITEELE